MYLKPTRSVEPIDFTHPNIRHREKVLVLEHTFDSSSLAFNYPVSHMGLAHTWHLVGSYVPSHGNVFQSGPGLHNSESVVGPQLLAIGYLVIKK